MIRLALLLALLPAIPTFATCVPGGDVCSYSDLASCCGATSCTLDGPITIKSDPQQPCTLDFGPRDVTLSGSLSMPGAVLTLRAASLRMTTGTISGGGRGGSLTVVTTGHATPAVALTNPGARIDLTGTERGGSVTIHGDGRIDLSAGSILVGISGTTAAIDGNAGDVVIDTTVGDVTVASRINADGGVFGASGLVQIRSPANLTIQNTISSRGGLIDLSSEGALRIPTATATLFASAPTGSGGDGGDVLLQAGSANLAGTIDASGDGPDASGGSVSIDTRDGQLVIASGGGIAADGDGGEVTLDARSLGPTGNITISAPVSAQGQGSVDSGASGGTVLVTAGGSISTTARIDVGGLGGGSASIDMLAQDSITIGGLISGTDPGDGAEVSLESDATTFLNADVILRGSGGDFGNGGALDVRAGDGISVAPRVTLDMGAVSGDGGDITLTAQGEITVGDGALLVTDSTGADGQSGDISLRAGTSCSSVPCRTVTSGGLTIAGKVFSRGDAPRFGATIELSGCAVDLLGTADIAATGDAAAKVVGIARTTFTVRTGARIRATQSTSVHLPAGTTFLPQPGTTVTPSATVTSHPVCSSDGAVGECGPSPTAACCLMPCPTCGDGTVTFPEQCDVGGGRACVDASTDCTAHCRVVSCADASVCTADTCDPARGCLHPLQLGPGIAGCDDGNACNGRESCVAIVQTVAVCRPGTPPNCDDGNVCTDDCNPAAAPGAECVRINRSGIPCSNGNRCDGTEVCQNGVCAPGTPIACPDGTICDTTSSKSPPCEPKPCTLNSQCSDGNPCTRDQCTAGFCRSTPDDTLSCSDGLCNGADHCVGGVCVHDPACVVTDDGLACTLDFCDPTRGCVHDPVANCCEVDTDCQADNPCAVCNLTNHTCVPDRNCCLTTTDCDDQNVCTADACTGLGGNAVRGTCQHTPVADGPRAGCGDACTDGARCSSGTCALGTPHVCTDDGDACTDEVCDPFDTDGDPCHRDPIANCCHNLAECDDGNTCTDDACESNRCRNLYTRPGCRECDTGKDSDQQCTSPCSVATPESCIQHECQPITPIDCDDQDRTTVDSCAVDENGDPICRHRCTPSSCNDGDACTVDSCDAASGTCRYAARLQFDAVTCHLDPLNAILAAASSDDINPALLQKATHVLAVVSIQLETVRGDVASNLTRSAAKLVKKIGKELGALDRKVKKAAAKRIPLVSPPLAAAIRGHLGGARGALGGVLTP